MDTQQLIDAVRAATKTFELPLETCYETITYVDADVLLAALESIAAAEKKYMDDMRKRLGSGA